MEEVVVGEQSMDRTERLSINGWFHAAQEGEEGYIPEAPAPEMKNSREQLVSLSSFHFHNNRLTVVIPLKNIDVNINRVQTLSPTFH